LTWHLLFRSLFSNFIGIDFRSADERQAEEALKPAVQVEEEVEVMTEEERARGEITAAESKRIRYPYHVHDCDKDLYPFPA
jgi:hypothetical protein